MLYGNDKLIDEDYFNMIVHEIKNPLSLIKANVDYICLCDKNKVHSKNLGLINNEINKINDLVNNILKSNQDKIYEDPKKIFLSDIITDVINEYKESYSNKIYFIFDGDNQKIQIPIPQQELSIILSNLIKNSIEAILPRDGEIKINTHDFSDFIEIEIKDNGPGIDLNIFNKYEKNLPSVKKNGSGVGLSICKNILAKYNAFFTLQNQSRGVVAKIRLPKN